MNATTAIPSITPQSRRPCHASIRSANGKGTSAGSARAFTLVELLTAMAVLSILLILTFLFIERTSNAWTTINSKTGQFREARQGLEALAFRLGAATLDQYIGYEYRLETSPATATTIAVPAKIGRRSELRFISGKASQLVNSSNASTCPTHAVFFTAPSGITGDDRFAKLSGLLNIWGYFIQWGNVDLDRPSIISKPGPYRFRLMQFVQPAEEMALYSKTSTSFPQYNFVPSPGWQADALTKSPGSIRPIANNVVALILLPAMNASDTSGNLSPDYSYDSEKLGTNPTTNSRNRLPPVMQVVMYSIDEASAIRLAASPVMPDLYTGLFTDPTKLYPRSGDIGDLGRFEANLRAKNLRFHRQELAIELLPQPWSTSANSF